MLCEDVGIGKVDSLRHKKPSQKVASNETEAPTSTLSADANATASYSGSESGSDDDGTGDFTDPDGKDTDAQPDSETRYDETGSKEPEPGSTDHSSYECVKTSQISGFDGYRAGHQDCSAVGSVNGLSFFVCYVNPNAPHRKFDTFLGLITQHLSGPDVLVGDLKADDKSNRHCETMVLRCLPSRTPDKVSDLISVA